MMPIQMIPVTPGDAPPATFDELLARHRRAIHLFCYRMVASYTDAEDLVWPQHIVEIYAALGGEQRDPGWDGAAGRSASQLAILPGVNHYTIAQHPLLAATVDRFLTGK